MTTNLYEIDQAKPPRKRRKDARPSELLNAALEAFARHGFHATSMEEIGAQAGVSKGTVFRRCFGSLHFPGISLSKRIG